jgi:hypothetical protein
MLGTATTAAIDSVNDSAIRADGDRGDDTISGAVHVVNKDHHNNINNDTNKEDEEQSDPPPPPGEATILVSEFPPPPFYYSFSHAGVLKPPEIPQEALIRGTLKAAANAARQRAEAEQQQRLAQTEGLEGADQTGAVLGGISTATSTAAIASAIGNGENRNNGVSITNNGLDFDKHNEGEGDETVVGVFGEIVEDPLMVQPLDVCEDPTIVRDEVKRLNRLVLQGFVRLVQDLVNRPAENKKQRDELSYNVFLMIQEANKFREHQARELLIELLERQLEERRQLIAELQIRITQADVLLP